MVRMVQGEGSALEAAAMGRGRSHQMETFTSTAIPVFESTGCWPSLVTLQYRPVPLARGRDPYRGVKVSRSCLKVNPGFFLSLGGAGAPWWQQASPAGHFS